jgi:hypothetical protein
MPIFDRGAPFRRAEPRPLRAPGGGFGALLIFGAVSGAALSVGRGRLDGRWLWVVSTLIGIAAVPVVSYLVRRRRPTRPELAALGLAFALYAVIALAVALLH